MIELDKMGVGNACCLEGIGAALSGFVESVKAARTVVVDGCLVGCGKMAFKKYGTEPFRYFVITELGFEKTHYFSKLDRETEVAFGAIASSI